MSSFPQWLAHPQALLLLLALPLLGLVALVGWLMRRRAWRLLGISPARVPLASRLARRRLLRGLLVAVGLLLVGFAAAGPQWGRAKTAVVSAARDLVVVLDVSRSMLAETPSRQVRAQRLLNDLANTIKQRGGHRVALVVVAAKSQLAVPLTTDYDLFQIFVNQQDAARLPADLRPGKDGPPSGTRLGEGLRQAVAAHDPKFHSSQVILLVSDGDDPLDDGEWKEGADAARRAGIPVFVVGVGDPTKASNIRVGDKLLPLTHDGIPIETKLDEEVLRKIASRTDGVYFPVRTESVAAGTLFPALLQAAGARSRESPLVDHYHQRFRWFLAAGLVFLSLTFLVGDRKSWRNQVVDEEMEMQPQSGKLLFWPIKPRPAAALALIAVLLAGATADVESLLRQGNEAFVNKDYAAALKLYEQAEDSASDPGLVAFNKGAALVRLGRVREAELCYLRCLQDRAAPAERRLRCLHDLGTALLQRGGESKDSVALLRAADCFEFCFKEAGEDQVLQGDAEHNLQLARLLWLKVRAEAKAADDPNLNPQDFADPRNNPMPKGMSLDGGPGPKDLAPGTKDNGKTGEKEPSASDQTMPGAGTVDALLDTDQLQPLDGTDAREILAREIRRIEREQAQGRGRSQLDNPGVKDW
jgi:Ca-activated chloride channel homolog